jgi:hypothetical protein
MTENKDAATKAGGSWKERNGGLVFGIAVFGTLTLLTLLMWLANN